MKNTTILCAAIAATMGLGTLAQAQDTRQERREARQEAREEARQERRQEARQDARQEQRRDHYEARRVPDYVNTPLANVRDPEPHQRHYNQQAPQRHYNNNYHAPQRHYYNAPNHHNHGYNHGYHQGYSRGYAPGYYASTAPRFYRGGYLPYNYRQPNYFVANWNAYPSLYAPPYGHQWVQVGNEFLLIAVTTGLIAHMLTM